ncbi:MAG TPA: XRE family transcriptional regulator [Candidatus Hydrogenedentes bacterium]|nr:XRE family transcriptional regulator [Candidatus Hydrogenedentota bacterium]
MTITRMRIERERAGMSRAAVARVAEMNASSVGQIENGRLRPYPSQLARIAAALGWEDEPERLIEDVAGGGWR